METHKLLERQLLRLKLKQDAIPATLKQWSEFLAHISTAYQEADQDRYLLERSMEISSRELVELNTKLQNAQHIAKLGYWFLDEKTGKMALSSELYSLLGLEQGESISSIFQFRDMLHKEDRVELFAKLKTSTREGATYEHEFRMLHPDKTYHWYYIAGHPTSDQEGGEKYKSGILMDISNRKKAELEVQRLNEQLILTARQAGMADIATSILHNIGNVLNSVSVSLDVLKESLDRSQSIKIINIADLIKKNLHDLISYLSADAKGKLIPQYIIALSENIDKESKVTNAELENLKLYIMHLKEIVDSQNAISRVSGVKEYISIPEVVDNVLKMTGYFLDKNKEIHIKTDYNFNKKVLFDKTKLTQILVNILQNAKESIFLNKGTDKKEVSVLVKETAEHSKLQIIIEDTGIGILPKNMTKIFSFGFSTKTNGHGFGLHASALAANEMGGNLTAKSQGEGKGATFILTLPLRDNI
jgi:PAS domain S-box-containing protein